MHRSPLIRALSVLFVVALWTGCTTDPTDKSPPVPKAEPLPGAAKPPGGAAGAGGETYRVKFESTKGDFVVEVHPEWAPNGAARFRELVEAGFYDDCRFFRVIKTFMVQFGISGDPKVMDKWRDEKIPDDEVTQSNKRGYITFATSGRDSRTTQVFINYKDNAFLDGQGFSPFGEVVEGMDVVDQLNDQYGGDPSDAQPQIQSGGNAFLDKTFPGLDSVKKAIVVPK